MFEKFNKNLQKANNVAYICGGKQRRLVLKGDLRAEFTEGDHVELYFDKETLSVGIKKTTTGYSVTFAGGQLAISMNAFCANYGLESRYIVEAFTKEGEMFVLPLTEVKNNAV